MFHMRVPSFRRKADGDRYLEKLPTACGVANLGIKHPNSPRPTPGVRVQLQVGVAPKNFIAMRRFEGMLKISRLTDGLTKRKEVIP